MATPPRLGADAIATLFLVALLPATAAPGFTDLSIFRQATFTFGGLIVLTLWLFGLARGRALAIRGRMPLALFTFAIAAFGLSITWSPRSSDAIPAFASALAALGPALALLAPTARRISLRAITRALAAGLAGAALIAILHASGASPYTPPAPYPDTHNLLLIDAAAYAAIALPITLATALRYDGIDRGLAISCALAAAALLGASHDALLVTAAGIGLGLTQLLAIAGRQHALFSRTTAAILIAGAVAGASAALTPPPARPLEDAPVITAREAQLVATSGVAQVMEMAERLPDAIRRQIPATPTSDGARSYLANTALAAFAAEPITGHGAGQTPATLDTHADRRHAYLSARYAELPAFAHVPSTPLSIALQIGLLGLAPFLLIALVTTLRAAQAFRQVEPTEDVELGNLWGATASAATALSIACLHGLALKPSATLLAVLAGAATIATAHTVLGDRSGLHAWQPTDEDARISSGLLAAAVVPFAAALACAFLIVPLLLGNYHRQWGNLFLLQPDPAQRVKAVEQYERALEQRPDDVHIHDVLAQMAAARADFDDAIVHLKEALSARPDHVSRLIDYARALRLKRQFETSRSVYRRALELDPRRLDTYIGYAALHASSGEYDRAIHVIRSALDLELPPELAAEMHAQMARIYRQDSRWEDALRHLDFAAALAADSDYAINLGHLRNQLERQRALEAKSEEAGGHGGHGGHSGGTPGLPQMPPPPPPQPAPPAPEGSP